MHALILCDEPITFLKRPDRSEAKCEEYVASVEAIDALAQAESKIFRSRRRETEEGYRSVTDPSGSRDEWRDLILETLRAGTVAGLAMVPFGLLFRSFGLRVNEYGRKTLELLVGDVAPPLSFVLTSVEHLIISWLAAVPLLLGLRTLPARSTRLFAGLAYGAIFYVAINSLALPIVFGDPTPWQLGFTTVYPSLIIHLVYGLAIALVARPGVGRRATP